MSRAKEIGYKAAVVICIVIATALATAIGLVSYIFGGGWGP